MRMPILMFLLGCGFCQTATGDERPSPERGYELLVSKPYLPVDFDQETFDEVWKRWPEPLRSQAEKATRDERRRMAYSRYGITARPDAPDQPLQYVIDPDGQWHMNCFACHGGQVAGRVVPGLPNSRYALQTLTEEIRETKAVLGKPLGHLDIGSFFIPLSHTHGTTNAVMFGVALLAGRDADLNFVKPASAPAMVHHDMDAPPWWNYRRRNRIYIDGFVEKGHRALMQFMLVKQNGPEEFRKWEADFRHVHAYLESLRAPRWPFAVDRRLAEKGRDLFSRHCAKCHGTYGPHGDYPERVIPIDRVGTDRVRWDSLSPEHRGRYAGSWFAHYGKKKTDLEPAGYLAPPLDGIWASAPYFHNGSVPTLWHILHPQQRPAVWKRTENGYDRRRVGLEVTEATAVPKPVGHVTELRTWFDTRGRGKSAAGHTFPDAMNATEKQAVLEYLKTL